MEAQLPGQTEDLRHVVLVVRGDGHVEPHRDARVLQGAEVVHHFLEHGPPAQPLIGSVGAAVEGDVEAQGRVLLDGLQQFAPEQGAVGVHRHQEPHVLEGVEELGKVRAQQRFPTGEEEKDHPGLPGLLSDGEPLRRGELPPAALGRLGLGLVDIAHVAVEVAPGGQLEGSGHRETQPGPLLVDVGGPEGLYHLGKGVVLSAHKHSSRAFTALSSGRQSSRRTGVSPMRRERVSVAAATSCGFQVR